MWGFGHLDIIMLYEDPDRMRFHPRNQQSLEMDSTRTNLEPHVQTAVRSQDISTNLPAGEDHLLWYRVLLSPMIIHTSLCHAQVICVKDDLDTLAIRLQPAPWRLDHSCLTPSFSNFDDLYAHAQIDLRRRGPGFGHAPKRIHVHYIMYLHAKVRGIQASRR